MDNAKQVNFRITSILKAIRNAWETRSNKIEITASTNGNSAELVSPNFTTKLRLTAAEFTTLYENLQKVILPDSVNFFLNGKALPHRIPFMTFESALPTGEATVKHKQGRIAFYQTPNNSGGCLYECGIPIMLLDSKFDVNVNERLCYAADNYTVSEIFIDALTAAIENHASELKKELEESGWDNGFKN
jgi:hypothetical protein